MYSPFVSGGLSWAKNWGPARSKSTVSSTRSERWISRTTSSPREPLSSQALESGLLLARDWAFTLRPKSPSGGLNGL